MPDTPMITELLPPEGSGEDLGKKVFTILQEVIEDKKSLGLHDKWMRHYRMGKNDQWEKQLSNAPLVSANMLHTHRQRTVNTLTDNNPTFNVHRLGEHGEDEWYQAIEWTASYWWGETEQQDILELSVISGETYGCAIEKVQFNADLESGLGEIEAIRVDPYHFGVYPTKTWDVQKADAVLYFYPMSVREARRRWPKYAAQIKPDSDLIKELGEERREVQAGSKDKGSIMASIGGVVQELLNKVHGAQEDSQETLIVECWCKDYSTVTEKDYETVKDDVGREFKSTVEVQNPKYPGFIRYVVACCGGKVVLEDRPNPSVNWDLPLEQVSESFLYDKFPFSRVPSVKDPENGWGMSDFEQLLGLQVEANKCLSQITYHKDRAARPKIINPKDSGVDNSEFTNIQGIINPSSSMVAQAIKYMEFPNNTQDIQLVLNLYKELFFMVAGSFELEQAQTPGREVVAYKAIAALLERAATMMRGKIRNYHKLIRMRGRMWLSLAQNWYTEDRFITRKVMGRRETVKIMPDMLRVPAKLSVVNGSTLPQSQMAKQEQFLQLHKQGAIDTEALLEELDISNRADILERMQRGPLAGLIDKMAALGIDDQRLQVIEHLAQMDDKEFEKALKAGELPMLAIPDQQAPEDPKLTAEVEKAQMEARKTAAETELTVEKIMTERVEQQVKQAGIQFDQQKLEMERMELLKKFETEGEEAPPSRNRPGYNERGMQSNNQEA